MARNISVDAVINWIRVKLGITPTVDPSSSYGRFWIGTDGSHRTRMPSGADWTSASLNATSWNASTNTPTLADGVGTIGQMYRVSSAGTQDLGSGSIDYIVNDIIVYNDNGIWQKIYNEAAAASAHSPVTVLDSSNIDFTLATQQITADLTDTAVTPGSYTNSSITVDQKGRLTAASSAANTANLQVIDQDLATTDDVQFNGQVLRSSDFSHTLSDYAIEIQNIRATGGGATPALMLSGEKTGGTKVVFGGIGYSASYTVDPATLSYIYMGGDGATFSNSNNTMRLYPDGGVYMMKMKSGATQAAAGAAANELWKTSGHATLPDNVVLIGV